MLSIVVPLFNKEKYIGFTLDSILKADIPVPYEIIVIDDASTDKSTEIVRSYPVKLIINERNRGVSYTRNRGVYESKGSIIAIIDSDIVIKKDTIKTALEIYSRDANQVINGYWEEDSYNQGLFPSFLAIKQNHYMLREHKGREKFVIISMSVFCLMKKSIFIESGGYNEKFIHPGGEEYDLAYRINKKYPINWYRDLTVYHNCRYFKEYFFDLYTRSMNFLYTVNRAKNDKNYDLKRAQDFPEIFKLASVFFFCMFVFLTVFINHVFFTFILMSLCCYLFFSMSLFIHITRRKSLPFAFYCLFMDFLLYFPKGLGFLLGIWEFVVFKKEKL